MAVTVAYGSLLGGFAWELVAFKAEFNTFGVGAVADLAELVFPCNAANAPLGQVPFAFLGIFHSDSTNTNFHFLNL